MCLRRHRRAHPGLAFGPTYVVYRSAPLDHLPHTHLVQYSCFRSGMVVQTRLQEPPPRHTDIGWLYLQYDAICSPTPLPGRRSFPVVAVSPLDIAG